MTRPSMEEASDVDRTEDVAGEPGAVDGRVKTLPEYLATGAKYCWYVDETMHEAGRGFRPSVVIEDVAGHFPNGGDGVEPWWGPDLEEAKKKTVEMNELLGLSAQCAARIIGSSFRAANLEREPEFEADPAEPEREQPGVTVRIATQECALNTEECRGKVSELLLDIAMGFKDGRFGPASTIGEVGLGDRGVVGYLVRVVV